MFLAKLSETESARAAWGPEVLWSDLCSKLSLQQEWCAWEAPGYLRRSGQFLVNMWQLLSKIHKKDNKAITWKDKQTEAHSGKQTLVSHKISIPCGLTTVQTNGVEPYAIWPRFMTAVHPGKYCEWHSDATVQKYFLSLNPRKSASVLALKHILYCDEFKCIIRYLVWNFHLVHLFLSFSFTGLVLQQIEGKKNPEPIKTAFCVRSLD